MAHQRGSYLGGIRTLEDILGRCVIRPEDDCWHLRTARGKPMPKGQTMRVFAHGQPSSVAVRPLVMRLAGRRLPSGWCVVARCDSYDCVNPDHLVSLDRPESVRYAARRGAHKTVAKTIGARISGAKRSKVCQEVWGWVYESTQSSAAVAHALDVAHTHIASKRAKRRASLGSLMFGGV